MSETTKRIVAVVLVLIGAAALIYGTYLPYRKSRLYITALESASKATSLDTFLVPYMSALDAPSPMGQEELVRNFGGTVANIVNGAKAGTDQTIVRALGATLDLYAKPVLEDRSGLSQAQTYYTMTSAYRVIDERDGTKNFRERYYALLKRGLEISPDRPQFLYGLVDYEQRYGDNAQALIYAERVKELWPADRNIDRVIAELKN